MGLPMFQEPDEAIAQDAAAKLDKAAAIHRSAIRRETTVRPHQQRYYRTSESRRINLTRQGLNSLREEEREANRQILELEAELERLRSSRLLNRIQQGSQTPRSRGLESDTHSDSSPRVPAPLATDDVADSSLMNRDDNDTDAGSVSHRSFTSRQTINQHLPRPPRESNLRFEYGVADLSPSSPQQGAPLSPALSSDRDGLERAVFDGPELFRDRLDDLTPEFAPARGPYRPSSRIADNPLSLETPPPETWEASYPPLRRVGHISPRPLGVSQFDGLGDRRRSPSPPSDNHEEETWANLLTTMGGVRSSTATSFTSNRSDSAPRSRSSQNTTTSFGEINQFDESCDLDLPSGITEDDVRQIRDQHRQLRRREPDGPVMTGERGLREARERRARRLDIEMFQDILERMQRREEVPDEMWAAVGLSSDVVRNN